MISDNVKNVKTNGCDDSSFDFMTKFRDAMRREDFVPTELSLVYDVKGNDKAKVFTSVLIPYFIEDLKDCIVGVAIGSMMIFNKQSSCNYNEMMRLLDENKDSPVKFLSVTEFEVLKSRKWVVVAFNETIKFLRDRNVDADFFDLEAEYWTRFAKFFGQAYSMKEHKIYEFFGEEKCLARFVSYF